MTIFDFVFHAENLSADRIAIINNNMSYRDLYKHIRCFANILLSKCLPAKSNILILMNNCPSFVIAYFAIMMAGHVTVLADPNMKNEIVELVKDCNIGLIVMDKKAVEVSMEDLLKIENCTILEKHEVYLDFPYEIEAPNIPIAINDEALILCSSGSTGKSKYVVNSHYTLIEALKNYTYSVPIKSEYKLLSVTPLYHSYCMGSCMLAGLYCGASFLFKEEFNPKRILDSITNEKIDVFHGVPYMYELFCDVYNPRRFCMDSLKLCISAGAALTEATYLRFYDLTGKVIHQEYGSTETGTIAVNLNNAPELGYRSVGKALHGVTVKSISEDGRLKLYMKSEGHAVRYYNGQDFDRSWHKTGDLGYIKDNYIFITGRDRDFINVAGKKVDPNEIIQCLMQHEAISAAQVTGVVHKQYGEIIYACIESKQQEITPQDIVNFCKSKIAAYKIPRIIDITTSIPKSGLNKPQFRSRFYENQHV